MTLQLEPSDIFLTRGDSFVSRAIRFFTRGKGEARTEVNHVGVVVAAGDAGTATIVEALTKVKRRRMSAYRGSKTTLVAVYRPKNLSTAERQKVARRAARYVGADYGYVKLVAHFLDWCLGGAYVFRRIASMDRYPICSWVVAYSFEEVGENFGVPAWAADPDHIWDWVTAHPGEWVELHPLDTLR